MVEGVRLLRIVGLYKTSLYVHADAYIEGRSPVWISWAALYSFWALALLSIAGAVRPARGARTIAAALPVARARGRRDRHRAGHVREHALPDDGGAGARGAGRGRDRCGDQHHSRSATIGSDGTRRRV